MTEATTDVTTTQPTKFTYYLDDRDVLVHCECLGLNLGDNPEWMAKVKQALKDYVVEYDRESAELNCYIEFRPVVVAYVTYVAPYEEMRQTVLEEVGLDGDVVVVDGDEIEELDGRFDGDENWEQDGNEDGDEWDDEDDGTFDPELGV